MKKTNASIIIVIILLCSLCIIGCKKKETNNIEDRNSSKVDLTDPVTPTEVPRQEFVNLSSEEIEEVKKKREEYALLNEHYISDGYVENYGTMFMTAYYKYIGWNDLQLPVIVNYSSTAAQEIYGGTWEEIVIYDSTRTWSRGFLTVESIDYALINGEDDKVFIINDPSVEGFENYDYMWTEPPMRPFSKYMSWMRFVGEVFLTEDEGGYWIVYPLRYD